MFHIHIRLIPITEIALIASIALSISIGINLIFMPAIVARTEKRTYQKLKQSESALKTTTAKLSKSAKLDLIETIFQSPIGATLNIIKPDLYEKLKENPDRLEGYLDLYESLSARPEIKKLISNFMKKKEPQTSPYSDIEGMR
jgi:K+ transporter